MHRFVTIVANRFLNHMSALLLVLGLGLLTVGLTVRLSRHYQLSKAQEAAPEPSFAQLLNVQPLATMPLAATAPPPPDRIVIPAIDVDSRVVEVGWESRIVNGELAGNEWLTADFAAGFHKNSAPPGLPGNTVISGHNNIKGAVFKDIHLLDSGQPIYLYSGDERRTYSVEANFVVDEEGADPEQRRRNAEWIGPTADERLTLITCYPPWSNTHRTIIIARPVAEPVDHSPGKVPAE